MRKAHRRIKVREEDWGYLGCVAGEDIQEGPEGEIWLSLVGTSGVASAPGWRARLGAAGVRVVHYVLGWQHAL